MQDHPSNNWWTSPQAMPSTERLRELFDYEPLTGKLLWKFREDNSAASGSFNKLRAGSEAGSVDKASGYRLITLGQRFKTYAQRIIWKMVYDEEVPKVININGDPTDNRLINLALAPHIIEARIKKRWRVEVEVDGQICHQSDWDTEEEAQEVYQQVMRRLANPTSDDAEIGQKNSMKTVKGETFPLPQVRQHQSGGGSETKH